MFSWSLNEKIRWTRTSRDDNRESPHCGKMEDDTLNGRWELWWWRLTATVKLWGCGTAVMETPWQLVQCWREDFPRGCCTCKDKSFANVFQTSMLNWQGLHSHNRNWSRECVMHFMNVLVEQLMVKESMCVVKKNLLERHANEDVKKDARKSWQLSCYLKPKQVPPFVSQIWHCYHYKLVRNDNDDCLKVVKKKL